MTAKLREHAQLLTNAENVLVRQRVVERLIPGIEPDLHVGGRADDYHEGRRQHQQLRALA